MKDLIILGNGMAGMTAALYAKRANLDFKIVGRDEYDFGQIGNAILVENYPCSDSKSGFDLAMKLHDQLNSNNIDIEEHEVIKVFRREECYIVLYKDGTWDESRTIIYALGASHRQLNCTIEAGAPIHYCALCDGSLYKDKDVAVIGGGDVAFTQAEYLAKICSCVTILMCDENVTASPTTFERVKNLKNVDIVYNHPIDLIKKNNERYWALYSGNSFYQAQGIFVAIGMIPNTLSILEPGMADSQGYIYVYPDTLSSLYCPGFFAAGDNRQKKVRQGITAAADGAIAVNSVIEYLKNR